MELLPRLHWIEGRASNVYLWQDDEGLLMFDTGMPGDTNKILAYLGEAGFQPADVLVILITHADADHAGGAAELSARCQAPVYTSPATAKLLVEGKAPKHLPRDLSDKEVAQFLSVVDTKRDKAMVALMLYAGLRVREVTEVRALDITVPEAREAAIRLRVMGKGRKERMVYLKRATAGDLLAYLGDRATGEAQEPLFRNRFGGPITTSGVENRVKTYAARSGVEVTCHRLRHTYARWMVEGEVPILALARLMGHAHLQSTQRYIDSADPHVRRAYEEAMWQVTAPEAVATPRSPAPTAPAYAGEPTVCRQDPARFDGEQWQTEWPTWLREGCLAWLDHQWWQWKPSQRKHHTKVRLSQLRIFWTWQLSQRAP